MLGSSGIIIEVRILSKNTRNSNTININNYAKILLRILHFSINIKIMLATKKNCNDIDSINICDK